MLRLLRVLVPLLAAAGLLPLILLLPRLFTLTPASFAARDWHVLLVLLRESALVGGPWVLWFVYILLTAGSGLAVAMTFAIARRAWDSAPARDLAGAMACATCFTSIVFVIIAFDVPSALTPFRIGHPWVDYALHGLALVAIAMSPALLIRFAATFPQQLEETHLRTVIEQREGGERAWLERLQRNGAGRLLARFRTYARGRTALSPEVERRRWLRAVRFAQSDDALLLAFAIGTVGFALEVIVGDGAIAFTLMQAVFGAGLILPAVLLRMQLQTGSPDERRRVLWISMGFHVAVWLVILIGMSSLVVGALGYEVAPELFVIGVMTVAPPLTGMVILCFLAVSLFYTGSVDPRLLIRTTNLYGAFAVVGAVVFAGVENLIADVLATRLGIPPAFGPWIAGGAAALMLGPVRQRLEHRLITSRRKPEASQSP